MSSEPKADPSSDTRAAARQRRVAVIMSVAGLVMIFVGLALAALSNPGRFSLDPRLDRQIHLLAVSGVTCTAVGIGLFFGGVSHSTRSMPWRYRNRTNVGVGIGFALQLAGLVHLQAGPHRHTTAFILLLAGLPLIVWGCLNYAEGKGYPKWVGLLGAAGLFGLMVLVALPARVDDVKNA